MGRIVSAAHAPVEDVRVVVNTACHESKPLVEAVIFRATSIGQAQMPFSKHGRLVIEFLERGRKGGNFRQQTGRCAMAGQDRAHAGIPWIATAEQRRAGRRTDR